MPGGADAPSLALSRTVSTSPLALPLTPGEVGEGPPGSMPPHRLDKLAWAGSAVLLVQGLAMVAWSALLWNRFALTYDYSLYHQAWWLIAHGHLNPLSTMLGRPFWQNNFELMMWPLALIGVPSTHGPVLLWLQDVCLVGSELVAWRWMCEVTATRPGRQGRLLAGVGLLLLVLNPWAWWSISWDFHMEPVAVLCIVLAAYDLAHERRRTWLWVTLTLLCGDAEATWVAGLGIAALLAGRRWRAGLGLIALGAGWVLLSIAVHGDSGGNVIATYGYLARTGATSPPSVSALVLGILTHPETLVGALIEHGVDLWANVAPGGLIGMANPWTFGMALPILLADDLIRGNLFAVPAFQGLLLYVIIPLGTVLTLTKIHRRWPGVAIGLGILVVANAAAWSAVWAPQTPATWLRISPPAAALLDRADAAIPSSAEVVASQGVAGRFSDRALLYPVMGPSQRIPLRSSAIWWVIAPTVGIETAPSADEFALVQDLAGSLHAHLVLHGHGIFVFDWTRQAGRRFITVPGDVIRAPGWLFPGAAGSPVLRGSVASWHLTSTGHKGYVLAHDYWREPPGRYQALVTVASSGPLNLEVWNETGGLLLVRRSIPPARVMETVVLPVVDTRVYPPHLFQGWGPFQFASSPRPSGDRLEIRVWSPGDAKVTIGDVSLQRASSPTPES